MKTLFRRAIACALAALMLVSTAACGKTPAETTVSETTAAPETEASLPNIVLSDDFKLVRPELAGQPLIDAVIGLRKSLQEKSGLTISLASDWLNPREANPTIPITEILIGATNRPESAAAAVGLRLDDYVITAEAGKLVILGGSEEATVAAITCFQNQFAAMTTFAQTELFRHITEYPLSDIRIGDRSLAEYTLVYPAAEREAYEATVKKINSRLRALCGMLLPAVLERNSTELTHTIWLGPVNCAGASKAPNSPADWTVTVGEGMIHLNGGSDFAVASLFEILLDEAAAAAADGVATLTLTDAKGKARLPAVPLEAEADVRIMSSNILFDETLDGRMPLIVSYYLEHLPDMIGMQEVNKKGTALFGQLISFYGVTAATLPGGQHNYTPILYRKDKYTLLESGAELFDSRATDSKSMSWAVIEDKQTGQKLALCNAHGSLILASYNLKETDSVEGEQWRVDNVRQMLDRVAAIRRKYGNIPVFATGDFNTNASKQAIPAMKKTMPDAAEIAVVSKSEGFNSYHKKPDQAPAAGLPIDFVFVTDDVVEVRTHYIDKTAKGLAISDHCPVWVDVKLK